MNRKQALQTELDFWERFLVKGDYKNFPDWVNAQNHDEPFPQEWHQWIGDELFPTMLDVGCGPVTRFGSVLPDNRQLKILGFDPLAEEYAGIRERAGMFTRAPVTNEWPKTLFHLVVANNSLDHSEDPFAVLKDMERACLSSGHVIVCGYIDEANAARGYGLHQWNMSTDGRQLIVQNYRTGYVTRMHELEGRPLVHAQSWPKRRWFEVVFGPVRE